MSFVADVKYHNQLRERFERVPERFFTVHISDRHVQDQFTTEGRGYNEGLSLILFKKKKNTPSGIRKCFFNDLNKNLT